jgi:hypothetical protein
MSNEQRAVLGSGALLSLGDAAALTPYTPAYLNLLARQGKLPAVKIARNWVTTSTAVRGYLKKQSSYHQEMIEKLSASGKEQS